MTTFFLITAALGFGLLLLGLVFDDVFDFIDFFDGGGVLSAPVIGAFLGAFGVGGWAATSITGNVWLGLVTAGLTGLVLAWIALRLSLSLIDMPTDATPTSHDYLGQLGRVVTPVSVASSGEIMIRVGGSPIKLIARADADLALGSEVIVIEVLSPNAVRVMPADQLLEH